MKIFNLGIVFIALLFFGCKNSNKNITPEILSLEDKIKKENQTELIDELNMKYIDLLKDCLLYTSDAADERSSVDLGGRRIIKKKIKMKKKKTESSR